MENNLCRRNFIKKSALALGLSIIGTKKLYSNPASGLQATENRTARSPREVWIASMTLISLQGDISSEERINGIIKNMEEVISMKPDIICIPETFPELRGRKNPPMSERAEEVPGPVVNRIGNFAKENSCYIICPLLTKDNGHYYNAAVIIDRKGKVIGEYKKMYPVSTERVTPGPKKPPIFETDFGKIGVQICFDANWNDGWQSLSESGAEIVFFPSMFDGGRILNNLAWNYEINVVSSTWDTAARIIDITGDELYRSGRYPVKWVCGPVNLDRKVFHWNHMRIIEKIRNKYGRKIIIKSYEDEGCLTIESISPDITIPQIMKEFNLITYRQYLKNEGEIADKNRI